MGLERSMRLKEIFKNHEMKIANRLANKKVRGKREDIIKHKRDPKDYQNVLDSYKKEVRGEILKIIERCTGPTIFVLPIAFFLLYLAIKAFIFNINLSNIEGFFLLVVVITLILGCLFFGMIFVYIAETIDLVRCIFSKKYPDNKYKNAAINEYHTWIKIGEHRIADPRADGYGYFCESHNAIVVEDFKCSVCGKKTREENW